MKSSNSSNLKFLCAEIPSHYHRAMFFAGSFHGEGLICYRFSEPTSRNTLINKAEIWKRVNDLHTFRDICIFLTFTRYLWYRSFCASVLVPKLAGVGAVKFTLWFRSQQFQLYLIFISRFFEEHSMLPFNYAHRNRVARLCDSHRLRNRRTCMWTRFRCIFVPFQKITLTYHSRWNDARNFTAWSFSLSLSSWNVNRNQKRFHQKSESKTAQRANFLRFFSKFKRQIMKSCKIFCLNLDLIGYLIKSRLSRSN